ncbi:MAG: DUF3592 domain-containing protein [Candidatus Hydrogenedens sp.]|nr:DUF3592 domain-containing protein [Candidatus Hydrogenedens sp.]
MIEKNYELPKSGTGGIGCSVLFGLPFALVGLGAAGYLFYVLLQWQSMQSWVEVPAQIMSADLAENRDDDGGVTYRAVATYSYEWDGQPYISERVGITTSNDNVGSWQEDKARTLQRHVGGTYRCFVNPSAPSQAILFRDMRIEMLGFITIFACVFSTVGLGIVLAVVSSIPQQRALMQASALYPQEPWRWRPDWAEGRIQSSGRLTPLGLFFFGGLWAVFSVPSLLFLPGAVAQEQYLALLVLLFPAIALLLVVLGLYKLAHWQRFGGATLEIATVPAAAGGYLEGALVVPSGLQGVENLQAVLKCMKSRTVGSGKEKRTSVTTVWQTTLPLDLPDDSRRFGAGAGRLPFRVQIPFGLPDADVEQSGDLWHKWEFEANAELPGIDFAATFEIPVYTTEESQHMLATLEAAGETPLTAETQDDLVPEVLDTRIVRIRDTADGRRIFHYGRGRDFAMKFVPLLLGVVFMGVAYGINVADSDVLWFFTGGFGGVGFLMFSIGLWLSLLSTTVAVRPGSLRVTRSIILYTWGREIPEDELESFEPFTNVTVNDEPRYVIHAKLHNNKKVTVGSGFRGRGQAQAVIQQMSEVMSRAE